jgi:hypothetical protein
MNKLLFLSSIFCFTNAFAAISDVDKADIYNQNYIRNGGFESNVAGWTSSGGTLAFVTSGTNLLVGKGSATWDSSAAAQTLSSSALTIPNGLKGRNGEASCLVNVPSGVGTHKLQVFNGSSVISEQSIAPVTGPQKIVATFSFPSSGTVRSRLISVAANEPLIGVDDCFIGQNSNLAQTGIITDWIQYTPTGTFVSNVAYEGRYRRVGSDMEIDAQVTFTATTDGTAFALNVPGGYTIDVAKIGSSPVVKTLVGSGTAEDFGVATYALRPLYFSTTQIKLSALEAPATNVTIGGDVSNTSPITFNLNDKIDFSVKVPIVGWSMESAIRPESVGWRVDAKIAGANANLNAATNLTFTGVENAGLTLTNNLVGNTSAAEVPCSSTNPSTGTTCAVGDESIGVAFTIPKAGDYLACVNFQAYLEVTTGEIQDTFKIVETPNNAQTILQEGSATLKSSNNAASSALTFPNRLCASLNFSSPGKKTLRLFHASTITGTIGTHQVLETTSWEVIPLYPSISIPQLVGTVSTSSAFQERVERVRFGGSTPVTNCTANPCTIYSQSGDWVSSVSRSGSGAYTVNIPTGKFSETPTCVVDSRDVGTGGRGCYVIPETATSTSIPIECTIGSSGDAAVGLICMGKR